MADFKVITPKRDIARELARKYSTMTHTMNSMWWKISLSLSSMARAR